MNLRPLAAALMVYGAVISGSRVYAQEKQSQMPNTYLPSSFTLTPPTNRQQRLEQILSNTNLPQAAAASNVYSRSSVHIAPKGRLKARYDAVYDFAREYVLISKIAECLVDSKYYFRANTNGSYVYTNPSDETSTAWVLQDLSSTTFFSGAYYFTGERTFWDFEALLYVESVPAKEGGIEFEADIYAYSTSKLFRFLSIIPGVRKYFASEATKVITQFDVVYTKLMEDPEGNLRKILEFKDDKGSSYFKDDELEKVLQFYNRILLRNRTHKMEQRSNSKK